MRPWTSRSLFSYESTKRAGAAMMARRRGGGRSWRWLDERGMDAPRVGGGEGLTEENWDGDEKRFFNMSDIGSMSLSYN